MIRKRDFILFIMILLFLLTGIGSTIVYENWRSPFSMIGDINFSYSDKDLKVEVSEIVDDKQSNLERLKQKLASGEGLNKPVENIDVVPEPIKENNSEAVNRVVNYCSPLNNDTQIINNWPKFGLTVKEVEGARMVYQTVVVAVATTSSSSKPAIEQRPVLQLALNQVRGDNNNCIGGQIVGITTTGGLILNTDVSRYSAVAETTLIGYALDGFPIYGNKADINSLDQCGGENSPLGYRYYLRNSEDFVLSCFAGTPVTIK